MFCDWEPSGGGVACKVCGHFHKATTRRKCGTPGPAAGAKKRKQQEPVTCSHRGDVIRLVACQLCGRRGNKIPVYRCDKLGVECTQRKYKSGQLDVISCLACPSRS